VLLAFAFVAPKQAAMKMRSVRTQIRHLELSGRTRETAGLLKADCRLLIVEDPGLPWDDG
jgi:hypothetical protein